MVYVMLWNAINAAGGFITSLHAYRWRPLPYTCNHELKQASEIPKVSSVHTTTVYHSSLVPRPSEEERDECPAMDQFLSLLIHLYVSSRLYKCATELMLWTSTQHNTKTY